MVVCPIVRQFIFLNLKWVLLKQMYFRFRTYILQRRHNSVYYSTVHTYYSIITVYYYSYSL